MELASTCGAEGAQAASDLNPNRSHVGNFNLNSRGTVFTGIYQVHFLLSHFHNINVPPSIKVEPIKDGRIGVLFFFSLGTPLPSSGR